MVSQVENIIQHKGKPCLSVIIPTNGYSAMRFLNMGIIKKNVNKARLLLSHEETAASDGSSVIESKLDALAVSIDTRKFSKGIGIFVSPSLAELIYFPFEVQETVILDDSFEIRDLLYYQEYTAPYYVLMLSRNKIDLFRSHQNEMKELVDENFPTLYVDEHQYTKPSRGTSFGESLKSYEKDKSGLTKERMLAFFKETDHVLHKYLRHQDLIIVCGPNEETSAFMKVTSHAGAIVGTLPLQNHKAFTSDTISRFHQIIFKFKLARQKAVVKRLDEDYGNQQVAEGIENVWKAAQEGLGLLLAVEKDFKRTGYLRKNDAYHLHTFPPSGEYKIVADAVEDVIQTVREKSGRVVLVENEGLKKFHHIAMVLRYKTTSLS